MSDTGIHSFKKTVFLSTVVNYWYRFFENKNAFHLSVHWKPIIIPSIVHLTIYTRYIPPPPPNKPSQDGLRRQPIKIYPTYANAQKTVGV